MELGLCLFMCAGCRPAFKANPPSFELIAGVTEHSNVKTTCLHPGLLEDLEGVIL